MNKIQNQAAQNYVEFRSQAATNPAPAIFDDGEIRVLRVCEVNTLCQVSFIYLNRPTEVQQALFDEYGIDEQGYLGGFAIQQAVDLFYQERPLLQVV